MFESSDWRFGPGTKVGQAASLPRVSLMEPARESFLRRQEWLLLQVERGVVQTGLTRVWAEHLWGMQFSGHCL